MIFSEYLKGESSTPVAHNLFDTAEGANKLSRTDADLLHNCLAHILYLSKWAHPDIQLEMSFLWIIWRDHDVDNYKKLTRVIKYTQDTIGLTLILSIYKSVNIKWYVDASFEVHKDMRSHTGGFMTMITSEDYVKSSKRNKH